jgi:hypothetical protein
MKKNVVCKNAGRVHGLLQFVCAGALAIWGGSMAEAQTMAQKPIKLEIQTTSQSLTVGEEAEVEIICRGAKNEAVPAPRDYPVEVLTRQPSGKVDTLRTTISTGTSSQKLRVPLREAGMVELEAKHSNLWEGGAAIWVRPPTPAPARPPGQGTQDLGGSRAPASTALPRVTLRYSPQRRLLADGRDSATVQAFLLNGAESQPGMIRLRLFNSSGQLVPTPLVIPEGEDIGTSKLTSQDVQTVTVEYVSATPTTEVDEGAKTLQIEFGPPITTLAFETSPPVITLVEKSDLILRLMNSADPPQPVATDEPRKISFAIDAGRGDLAEKEITIPAGGFEGRTTFRPTWRGEVTIAASTPNLPIATAKVKVSLPVLHLVLTAIGGLAGGLIAYWRETQKQIWRIILGLITGFVFYWAFTFGVLPLIPREVVLNPLSAFALSVIGGWLGTEVFSMILKRLGLV